jgi:AraC-like DNA-binding protein
MSHRARTDEALREAARDLIRANSTIASYAPADIAASLGIGLRRLHRLFEGDRETVAHQLRASRLNSVVHQLLTSEALLSEVATTNGYGGLDQCARAFKKQFGMSMSDFRTANDRTRQPVLPQVGAPRK